MKIKIAYDFSGPPINVTKMVNGKKMLRTYFSNMSINIKIMNHCSNNDVFNDFQDNFVPPVDATSETISCLFWMQSLLKYCHNLGVLKVLFLYKSPISLCCDIVLLPKNCIARAEVLVVSLRTRFRLCAQQAIYPGDMMNYALLAVAFLTKSTLRSELIQSGSRLCDIDCSLCSIEGEDEESSLVTVFLVLPFLFSSVTIKNKNGKGNWRPSNSEMRDGFILHLRSHAEVTRYEQLAFTLQPLIIIIGPIISDIAQYFVWVDDTYYLVNSIITAVDCCFKIIHALHAQYLVESKSVWLFIQKGCFKLKTSWDTEYVRLLLSYFYVWNWGSQNNLYNR
ncbi:hypothetical protein AGLY_016984 [Aphis glycines]|uniref:Uncharacterized protein n=1 Tax=Aphis glycines TaxID=307491 RepID=A0A6G0SY58_APHGL|nr:hypothetical protein AGLY_016984 [Aphis glycines]